MARLKDTLKEEAPPAHKQQESQLVVLRGGSKPMSFEQQNDLFERYRSSRDQTAFAALYDMFEPELYTFGMRMFRGRSPEHQRALTEDSIQITFKDVVVHARSWKSDGAPDSFRRWLRKIHQNACLKLLKDRGVRLSESVFHTLLQAKQDEDALHQWIEQVHEEERFDAELAEALEDAVDSLPPALKRVLLLRREGFKDKEIAEIIGRREGTVRSHLSRARAMMKEFIAAHRPELL